MATLGNLLCVCVHIRVYICLSGTIKDKRKEKVCVNCSHVLRGLVPSNDLGDLVGPMSELDFPSAGYVQPDDMPEVASLPVPSRDAHHTTFPICGEVRWLDEVKPTVLRNRDGVHLQNINRKKINIHVLYCICHVKKFMIGHYFAFYPIANPL